MIDDEEKRKIVEEQLKKDLNVSKEDEQEVMKNIEKRYTKKMRAAIRWSLIGIAFSAILTITSFYIAITEKRWLYWFFAFIFLGLAMIEMRKIHLIANPQAKTTNMVKYCAQITDETSSAFPNVRRQDTFPTVEEARAWAEYVTKDGESARIIDTANGKVVGTYKKEMLERSN